MGPRRGSAASLLGALVAVTAVLLVLLALRNTAETRVADLAGALPLGWAFAAGVVSSVNPCGFFLLPAYLSYQLGSAEAAFQTAPVTRRAVRAMALAAAATAGFVAVMGLIGALVAGPGATLVGLFPYAGVTIGAALGALGLWMLVTGRTVGIAVVQRVAVAPRRHLGNVFLFGVAYALGSLSCTLPVFLLVVGGVLATGQGIIAGLGQFISYALGMGTILVAVTLGTALLRGVVVDRLCRLAPHVHRASALFLLGAGLYLIAYWVWLSGTVR
ncbi:MAG: cytochrome c biogenesis protein CcdA [Armatimonadota bacterium]|nr:cytochrome c biogenesis protein CcdA [Armatimonadota bacterium]